MGNVFGEKGLKECLCRMFGPPYWPLPLDQLPALVRFHEIQAGDVFFAGGSDPGADTPWRTSGREHLIPAGGGNAGSEPASVVYGLDCELTDAMLPKLKEFAGACGLLICDACYTEAELMLRQGWGTWFHRTVPEAASGKRRRSRRFSCIMNGAIRIRFCESRRKCHWRRIRPVCLRGKAWLSGYMDNDR